MRMRTLNDDLQSLMLRVVVMALQACWIMLDSFQPIQLSLVPATLAFVLHLLPLPHKSGLTHR